MTPFDFKTNVIQIWEKKEKNCLRRQFFSHASMIESKASEQSVSDDMQRVEEKELPSDYVVKKVDVICARGKGATSHNSYYTELLQAREADFLKTTSKSGRHAICVAIVKALRAHGACFIKRNQLTDRWWDIGDIKAREKVGHAIRDRLTSKGIPVRGKRQQQSPAQKSSEPDGSTRKRSRSQDDSDYVTKRQNVDSSILQKHSRAGNLMSSTVDLETEMIKLLQTHTATMSNTPSFGSVGSFSRDRKIFGRYHNNGHSQQSFVGSQSVFLSSGRTSVNQSAVASHPTFFQMLKGNIDSRMVFNSGLPLSIMFSELTQHLQNDPHCLTPNATTGGSQAGTIISTKSNNPPLLGIPLTNPNDLHQQQQQCQYQSNEVMGIGALPDQIFIKQHVERSFSSHVPHCLQNMPSHPWLEYPDESASIRQHVGKTNIQHSFEPFASEAFGRCLGASSVEQKLNQSVQLWYNAENKPLCSTIQGEEFSMVDDAQIPPLEVFDRGLCVVDAVTDKQMLDLYDDPGLDDDPLLNIGSPLDCPRSEYIFR
jgi:hypothetical protein